MPAGLASTGLYVGMCRGLSSGNEVLCVEVFPRFVEAAEGLERSGTRSPFLGLAALTEQQTSCCSP